MWRNNWNIIQVFTKIVEQKGFVCTVHSGGIAKPQKLWLTLWVRWWKIFELYYIVCFKSRVRLLLTFLPEWHLMLSFLYNHYCITAVLQILQASVVFYICIPLNYCWIVYFYKGTVGIAFWHTKNLSGIDLSLFLVSPLSIPCIQKVKTKVPLSRKFQKYSQCSVLENNV